MLKDPPILALALGQTLVWAGLYYVFPALVLHWEVTLGFTKPQLSFVIATALICSACAAPVAGRVIDKGYGSLLMSVATITAGLLLVLLSQVTVLWQFYLVWACMGVAMSGCLYEACFAVITRSRGANARDPIIWVTLWAGLASTLSFPSAYALTNQFGWQVTVAVFGLVVILLAAPLLAWGSARLEKENAPVLQATNTPIDRNVQRTKAFWYLAAALGLVALVQSAVIQHVLPIFHSFQITPRDAVIAASFIGPMQVAGRVALMWAGPHVALSKVATGAILALVIALLSLPVAKGTALPLFVLLFGSAYGTISVIRPLIARHVLGQQSFGAKSGALAMPYLIGFAVAPFIGALIWEQVGYPGMLLIMAVLAALAGLFFARAFTEAASDA